VVGEGRVWTLGSFSPLSSTSCGLDCSSAAGHESVLDTSLTLAKGNAVMV